jgi:hypothetical protein
VKAKIREMLERRQQGLPASPAAASLALATAASNEQYYTGQEVGKRLAIHPDTVKDLFRNETHGVIRIGNKRSTRYKKAHTTERYSASAIERLIRRLEAGEDPRYCTAA